MKAQGRALTAIELVFVIATLTLAAGYLFFGSAFVHLGIPLPLGTTLGHVPGTSMRLFVSEAYILVLFGLACASGRSSFSTLAAALRRPSRLLLLVLVFMAWGFLRALPDLRANPALVIRNACFVWYLGVSLLVLALPLRDWVIERCLAGILALAWLELLVSDVQVVAMSGYRPDWAAYLGFMVPTAYALRHKSWKVAVIVMAPIAFAIGAGYWVGFQRISLLGIAATIVVVPFLRGTSRPRYARGVALFAVLIVVSTFALGAKRDVVSLGYTSNPFKKAETNTLGVETFRWAMWTDAWQLFEERPILGVGFERQVVVRIFAREAGHTWMPNDRPPALDLVAAAPVAGPHNSYLNSIARVGVLGALILLIHLEAAVLLWRRGFPVASLVIGGLVLYAFVSVALEGPQRSMFGLLALGLALKLAQGRPARTPKGA